MDELRKLQVALTYIVDESRPRLEARGFKVKLDFFKDHVLAGDVPCSGYFCDEEKVLVCAVGSKKIEDWFGTYLHEESHFDQYIAQCKEWTDSQDPEDKTSDDMLDRFLAGEEVDGDVKLIMRNLCMLELDCEHRTVSKLGRFTEIFSIPEYIQKANAYVAFYRKVFDLKKWYDPEKAPYLNEAIWKEMPSQFMPDEDYFDDFAFDYINWEDCL